MLLLTDSLFRVNHVEKRRRYAELVEGVREAGGEALVGGGGGGDGGWGRGRRWWVGGAWWDGAWDGSSLPPSLPDVRQRGRLGPLGVLGACVCGGGGGGGGRQGQLEHVQAQGESCWRWCWQRVHGTAPTPVSARLLPNCTHGYASPQPCPPPPPLFPPGLRGDPRVVQIFSGLHVSGEQLNQLSGIAAILRFPLPELEDTEIPADV